MNDIRKQLEERIAQLRQRYHETDDDYIAGQLHAYEFALEALDQCTHNEPKGQTNE